MLASSNAWADESDSRFSFRKCAVVLENVPGEVYGYGFSAASDGFWPAQGEDSPFRIPMPRTLGLLRTEDGPSLF